MGYIGDCLKWSKKLSQLLTVENVSVFVLEIHSEIDKNKKVTIARLFTGAACLAGMPPCALISTSAGNTGINQRQLDMVGRAGPAHDTITFLQALGRNCRRDGIRGRYLVYFSWG